ncbi:hypothetical protein [Vogesella amnigena]|uniref:hypothetical protein n=1 Tax=Vogesella amnigena TaxID=1507449 RepID=UPI0036F26A31
MTMHYFFSANKFSKTNKKESRIRIADSAKCMNDQGRKRLSDVQHFGQPYGGKVPAIWLML